MFHTKEKLWVLLSKRGTCKIYCRLSEALFAAKEKFKDSTGKIAFNNLWLSMLQDAGVPINTFADSNATARDIFKA